MIKRNISPSMRECANEPLNSLAEQWGLSKVDALTICVIGVALLTKPQRDAVMGNGLNGYRLSNLGATFNIDRGWELPEDVLQLIHTS